MYIEIFVRDVVMTLTYGAQYLFVTLDRTHSGNSSPVVIMVIPCYKSTLPFPSTNTHLYALKLSFILFLYMYGESKRGNSERGSGSACYVAR